MKRRRLSTTKEESEDAHNVVKKVRRNHIIFYADVSNRTIARLRELFIDLEENKSVKDVTIHLNSQGGCAYVALGAYDFIRNSQLHVTGVVEGCAFSAASLMFMGCDERLMTRHSQLMIHQISCIMDGNIKQQETELNNTRNLMKQYVQIYAANTKASPAEIAKEAATDSEMSASRAKTWGFVHKIL